MSDSENGGVEAVKAKRAPDPELAAMRALQRVLDRLTDPKAKERVLLYVKSRVEAELTIVKVTGS